MPRPREMGSATKKQALDSTTWAGHPLGCTPNPQHWPTGAHITIVQRSLILYTVWRMDCPKW
eukprot:8200177-Karenia_brevis.AAC.1